MKKINLKLFLITTFILVAASSLFFVSGSMVFAQDSGTGLIPCVNNCGFADIMKLINGVVGFIFKDLVIPISAIMFAYAGFELVTSGGSTEKKSQAKKIFLNVAIGLAFAAGAYLIVHAILGIVGVNTGNGWNWFGF